MSGGALPIAIVGALVLVTVGLTVRAARRTATPQDHYVAGGAVPGWQNALALAGDQISAASFLGVVGAVALGGFNAFFLAIGFTTAYLLALVLVAEPLRNLGRFTLADAIATRFEGRGVRAAVAVATLVISTIYMVLQFVGAGLIAQLLLGIDFVVAVVVMGTLMTLYTFLGGMVATTYIQIFKSVLLLTMIGVLLVVVISRTGGNPVGPMTQAYDRFGEAVMSTDRSDLTANVNNLSLGVSLALGVMGLPHVLVRFLTVRDARAARTSARGAMWIFTAFFLSLPIFGYAALNEVGRDRILADSPVGNLAGPRLAEVAGGEVLFALVAGVTIATILAVLAGLAIAASGAAAHDLYTNVLRRGDVDPRRQLRVSRIAGIVIAVVAILLAVGARDVNVAFLANVAFGTAASTTMPALLLTIYWRRFNRTGVLFAIWGGLATALTCVALGPDVLGEDAAVFPLSIPAIVSVPAGFAFAALGTWIGRRDPAAAGADYDEIARRAFPVPGAPVADPERGSAAVGAS